MQVSRQHVVDILRIAALPELAEEGHRVLPDPDDYNHAARFLAPEARWAAAFGRIAGYSFAVAVVTGILLLPFFRPSMAPLTYRGSYRLLDGVPVSQAYQSVLRIRFDVRGGLLVRQVPHWSEDLFVVGIGAR